MMATTRTLLLCALAATAVACGEFSGGSSGGAGGGAPQQLSGTASTASINAFAQTLHPILRDANYAWCNECHEGQGPGSPHLAHLSAATAYDNVVGQAKVDLANPPLSRIVTKVAGGHHCWTPEVPVQGETNCQTNSAELLAAIVEWADIIDFGEGGVSIEETLASNTLTLADGIQDSSGERYSENLIALFEFKEGTGDTALDTSGHVSPISLVLEGDYEWMSGWGVQFNEGSKAVSGANYSKFYDEVADPQAGTGQYSVEGWMTAANVVQDGPARIITYSRNGGQRNMTLGQNAYNYVFRNRAMLGENGMPNGTPALETYDNDQDLQDVLQHVVITYDQFRGRRIYVDGVWTDDVDEEGPGRLFNWERNSMFLGLADEVNSDERQWEGQIRLVAIYKQALSEAQIVQNYQAGVGRRLLMRFDVSQWTTPGSAVEFIVSEFDNFSYMFCEPTYRTVNPGGDFRLANIRIAVNGTVPPTGQGFRRLDTQVTGTGKELSRQCSVIPKGPDPQTDQFTLVFEHLNGLQNLVEEGDPGELTVVMDPTPLPELGLRDFAKVNETMSVVTRVDPLDGPQATYLNLRQQLPVGFDLRSFVSSQQVGVVQLSLEYCSELVDRDLTLADADPNKFFPGFPFGALPETAFNADRTLGGRRAELFDPLYYEMIGHWDDQTMTGLTLQPDKPGVDTDLNNLADSLLVPCQTVPCTDPARTVTMAKGVCAAVLSSAAMSIH